MRIAARATEIDALLGAVIELARLTATPVPRLKAIYACTRVLEASVHTPATAVSAFRSAVTMLVHSAGGS